LANLNIVIPTNHPCYVRLSKSSKKPIVRSWQNSGENFTDILTDDYNLGMILGETSGILDVDLDSEESIYLADIVMPEPHFIFDRGVSDSKHFLYRAESFGPSKRFYASNKLTLVELRGNKSQTMIPPSTHPDGSKLTYAKVTETAPLVTYSKLLKSVKILAACSELARNWQTGSRHDLALGFSGVARKKGFQRDFVRQILGRICSQTNDTEIEDRLNAVDTTFNKPIETIIGFKGLVNCLGKTTAKKVSEWLGDQSEGQITSIHSPSKPNIGSVVHFGEFADKTNITEAKMGHAFAKWLDDKAIYIYDKKVWMIWNGSYWDTDHRSLITRLAFQFVTDVKEALLDVGKYADLSNLSQFESVSRLENIAKFASTSRSVPSSDFDTDLFLLVTPNVWIDLKTGQFQTPSPKILVSKSISVSYDHAANCPNFLKFVDDVFESDQELIGFVQRAIGYSLTGSTSEQCLFIMIGDGANGKSTFINVINTLLGLYGSTAASQTLIANGGNSIGDDLVDLIGARMITVSETEEGQSLAEAKIKQMTGGDRLKGRPLYGTHIQFNIIGKLWLATNSLPQINNTDHGIWRRIKAIPFNRTFSAAEQDKTLGDKLTKELPGILKWAIEGCLDWQANELQTPAIVDDQVAEYKSAMDSISQFIRDECEQGSTFKYPASKLYQFYREWCGSAGLKPQSQTAFKRSLEKLNTVYQQRSSSGLQWHGIQPCLTF